MEFLRVFDLDYGMWHIDFMIAALSWWYDYVGTEGYPTREQLDARKGMLYRLRNELLDAAESRDLPPQLADAVRAVFARDPATSRGMPIEPAWPDILDHLLTLRADFGEHGVHGPRLDHR